MLCSKLIENLDLELQGRTRAIRQNSRCTAQLHIYDDISAPAMPGLFRLSATHLLSSGKMTPSQNRYFNANCNILGSRELRICPNWLEVRFKLISPGRKLFVTLYASARNSTLCVSRKRNTRDN